MFFVQKQQIILEELSAHLPNSHFHIFNLANHQISKKYSSRMLKANCLLGRHYRRFQIDPSVDYRTAHPRKYPIRRKDNRQRFLYMRHQEEVLMNQVTQPYYPKDHQHQGIYLNNKLCCKLDCGVSGLEHYIKLRKIFCVK